MKTFTFEWTDKYFSKDEQDVFKDYLKHHSLESNIWDVFASLFNSGTRHTKPFLLKTYRGPDLVGAAIVIKCNRYGRALFNNRILSGLMDLFNIPFYLWIRFGCCMDMMSNTGFVKDPAKTEEVVKGMISYLQENFFLTIVNDYRKNTGLYKAASTLPALPHALIDTSAMESIQDYMKPYKNIGHKLKVFRRKGGEYVRVSRQLDNNQVASLKKCFLATTEKSVFYLPYQDLYLNSAVRTSQAPIEDVHYFIATINGEFIGYQAAIKTGSNLNALHGAFDRDLHTTHHAYDILFVKMTEFALENGIKSVDFGAVLNQTKQKMINKSIDMSYFLMSRYLIIRKVFSIFLKLTKIQGKEQMKYRH
jgi:hypothetical protein